MPKDPKPKAAKGDGPAKKGKADKDPNAPKRPLSAYMIFSQCVSPSPLPCCQKAHTNAQRSARKGQGRQP